MEQLLIVLFEKLDSSIIQDCTDNQEYQELKQEIFQELKVNPRPTNQMLWVLIRNLAFYIERYVG